MRTTMDALLIAAVCVSVAAGQSPAATRAERVLTLTQAATPQEIQEIAAAVRAVAGIGALSVVHAPRALALAGTAEQIGLAEWLVREVDVPAAQRSAPVSHAYRMPGSNPDAVRVFLLARATTPQSLQEIVTSIRSVADVPRIFVCNTPRAVAMRGSAGQIAVAEWLVEKLDGPADTKPARHEIRFPGTADDVARVFYLSPDATPQHLQEVAVALRTTAGIPRLFINNGQRALAMRGNESQMASAERLLQQLDPR